MKPVKDKPGLAGRTPRGAEWLSIRAAVGQGAFGVVYEAYDARRDCRVAVKTLEAFDVGALLMLKQEFRTTADIAHPNLVALYDLLQTDDGWFVVMEYIDGADILTHLRGGAPRAHPADPWRPDSDKVRRVFGQLARGVSALHGRGVLHRDLKPSNVLVTNEGRVVVLDFGLAAPLFGGDPRSFGSLAGTVAYLSPEELAGEPPSGASDWYAVGVILYEALTGRSPFAGSALEICAQKESGRILAPQVVDSALPDGLARLCAELMAREPAARPDADEICRRLEVRPARRTASAAVREHVSLIGRRAAGERLRGAFAALRQGESSIVHVQGASGVGKSALLRDFLLSVRAAQDGALVLHGRCYEQETLPFRALDSLVDALCRHLQECSHEELARVLPESIHSLARVFPVLRGVGPPPAAPAGEIDDKEDRQRAAAALREILSRIGDRAPVVLVIDDAQWGDADSVAFLDELLRAPSAPVLMLVVAYRNERDFDNPLVRRLRALDGSDFTAAAVHEIEVLALDYEESVSLARELLREQGLPAGEHAERIAAASQGNPFFLSELAIHAATAATTARPVEMSLEAMIRARVEALPEPYRRLLEVLSVTARPIEIGIAQRAAGIDRVDDLAMGKLRRGRLVRTRTEAGRLEVETYHDKVRETLKGGLPNPRLQSTHRELAVAWEDSGRADPETLAIHWFGAGDLERSSMHAARAADEAARGLAFDRAARLYQRAIEMSSAPADALRPLRVRLGHALVNAGRGAGAAAAYLAAAEGAATDESLSLRRQAADQQLASGHIDEGLATVRTVLETVGSRLYPSGRRALVGLAGRRLQIWARGVWYRERRESELPAAELARIDAYWCVARGLIMVDSIQAAHFQALHLLAALRAGERRRIARALAIESSVVLRGRQNRVWSARIVRAAREISSRLDDPYLLGVTKLAEGAVANFHGRFADSLRQCVDADAMLRRHCTGVTWELDTAQLYRLHSLYWLGAWGELASLLPALRREAEARNDRYLSTYIGTRIAHAVHLSRDQPKVARDDQRRSIAEWSPVGFQTQHYWDWFTRVEIDLYDGDARSAWQRVRARWGMHQRSLLHRHQALYIEALCMRARTCVALAAARPRSADVPAAPVLLRHAERYARKIEREEIPWGVALARMVRAGVAVTRGAAEEAEAGSRSAAAAFAALGMKVHQAAALYCHANIVGGAARTAERQHAAGMMASEGIVEPASIARMLAPGAWPE